MNIQLFSDIHNELCKDFCKIEPHTTILILGGDI